MFSCPFSSLRKALLQEPYPDHSRHIQRKMCEKPSHSALKPTRGAHAAPAQGRFSLSSLTEDQDRLTSSPRGSWALERFLSDKDDPFHGLGGGISWQQMDVTRRGLKTTTTEAAHGSAAGDSREFAQAKGTEDRPRKRKETASPHQKKRKILEDKV